MKKHLYYPGFLFVLLSCSTSMNVNAALDMNCRKTQFGQTPTLECLFTWSSSDDFLYSQYSMTTYATGPNGWTDLLPEGGLASSLPGNERAHYIANWSVQGVYTMYSNGSLFYWVPPTDPIFHPDAPAVDNVVATLP
jgi:hypothetical protein